MNICECIQCKTFPCLDVNHDGYLIPNLEIDPARVSVVLISESSPADPADFYYAGDVNTPQGGSLFAQTTILAFQDAGVDVASLQDILDLGVYLTPAVKCAKTGYGIKAATIKTCSEILEQELALFPSVQVYMLMGDVAIKAINYIAKRAGEVRVIPAGSTYKLRGQPYFFRGKRAFPSYLQVGPSFGIEKSKRRMIAEDIKAALSVLN